MLPPHARSTTEARDSGAAGRTKPLPAPNAAPEPRPTPEPLPTPNTAPEPRPTPEPPSTAAFPADPAYERNGCCAPLRARRHQREAAERPLPGTDRSQFSSSTVHVICNTGFTGPL